MVDDDGWNISYVTKCNGSMVVEKGPYLVSASLIHDVDLSIPNTILVLLVVC